MLTLARPDPTEEEVAFKKGEHCQPFWSGLGSGCSRAPLPPCLCPCTAARRPQPKAKLVPPASLPPAPMVTGKRQDNRAATRPGSLHKKGFRFFADDEDMYGLENILQVCQMCSRLCLQLLRCRGLLRAAPVQHSTAGRMCGIL